MSPASLLFALSLLAHNPDTSYAQIKITETQIETRLTYDVFTLLKITPLDDNNDGQLQRSELAAHASHIAEFLRSKVGLAVSDEDETADLGQFQGFLWPPDLGEAIAGVDFHSANGLIHFNFLRALDQPPPVVAIAFGFFDRFTERHTVLAVFECQGEKYEKTLSIFDEVYEYPTGFEPSLPQIKRTFADRLWEFFLKGMEHIFIGYDHICFLVALIIVSRFREIIKIVTSFTIAHSITLILAALDVVRLPSRLVESCIAATIIYVAVENIWLLLRPLTFDLRPSTSSLLRHRWLLTFCFGLIHGFGFANVLREAELPSTAMIQCLLSFNLGVEFGQLVIATCLLPLAYLLTHWQHGRKLAIAISVLLALFGTAWLVDRVFALELMQRIGL